MGESKISINGLYEFGAGTPLARIERLLWVDPTKSIAILIEVRDAHSREHSVSYRTFYSDVAHGTARPVEEPPEFKYLMQPDSAFSPAQIRERDDRCAAFEVFFKEPPEKRFDPCERSKLFGQITSRTPSFTDAEIEQLTDPRLMQILIPRLDSLRLKKSGRVRNPLHLNKGTLYKLYRRLLQSGKINGLISLRHKAGWHKENRLTHSRTKKLGRGWIGGTEEDREKGYIVTPDNEPILVQIGIMFHETRVGGIKLNWPDAVRLGREAFFSKKFTFEGDVLIPDMPAASELPSRWQIQRAYYKHREVGLFLPEREGDRAYNLKLRALTDDQRAIASRPLQTVQSDCWDVPIYIVHPVTRLVIGRPLLVGMRCTMSRMGVALALTWNHEGWRANLLSLENLVSDKVEYCKRLGFEIQPEWWPCQGHICENLLSDNGAWISKAAGHVRKALGMTEIWNTGTSRGDMKPIIETLWDDLYERVIKMLPGALPPHAISADNDPVTKRAWERATLDIYQLERIIARYFVHHNRFRFFKDYPLTDAMKGKVRPIPLELWNWGLEEDGLPNPISLDRIRINCLERVQVTVTRDGLQLQEGLFYTCDSAQRHGWFSRAAATHTRKLEALLDHRNVDRIFLIRDQKHLQPGDPELEECQRIKARREKKDIHLTEYEFERHRQKAEHNRYMQEMPAHDAWFDGFCDHVVAEAKELTAEALKGSKQTNEDLRPRRREAKDEENGKDRSQAEDSSELQSKLGPQPDVLSQASESEFELYRSKELKGRRSDAK
jgi:hypothetical protein